MDYIVCPNCGMEINNNLIACPYCDHILKENHLHEFNGHPANPKWSRTKEEKYLKDNFLSSNMETINIFEKKLDRYQDNLYKENITINKKISNLENYLMYLDKFKNFCYLSQGGTIYFQDMYEYCHNSKIDCFSWADELQKKLNYLRNNYDNLRDREKKIKTLRTDLYNYLLSHNDILQKEIYKDFNPLMKSDIQKKIRAMENDGLIIRKKKSGSYGISVIKSKDGIK